MTVKMRMTTASMDVKLTVRWDQKPANQVTLAPEKALEKAPEPKLLPAPDAQRKLPKGEA